MERRLDRTAAALWEEALAALPCGESPVWVPDEEWRRARTLASAPTEGWVGGHLGFLEDIAFAEAVRRCSAGRA